MKLSTISIAIVLASVAGVATAAGNVQTLPQVSVSAQGAYRCTPPNGATGHVCDSYDAFLRANFSPRQIGMLFGNRTSYPEYRTGGIDRLQWRYQTLRQQWVAAHSAVNAAAAVAVR